MLGMKMSHVDTDNRNLEEQVRMMEDRVAAMARKIIELQTENQVLQDALDQAVKTINEAKRLLE